MPLTKRNAHELRLPLLQLSWRWWWWWRWWWAMRQCRHRLLPSSALQKSEKNNEHLVRRKGVLWIWLGKSSVRLPAWLPSWLPDCLPAWLFELLLLSALAALMKNSFIVWNFALKCKIVFQTSRTQSALWALPTRREMLWKDAVKM